MNTSKNFSNLILLFALALSALGLWRQPAPTPALAAPAAQTTEAACNGSRSVQVSGAAVINVTPDRALLQLGVQTNGLTPDWVQAENYQAIQRVINAVKALGVGVKDIATDYYIVYPVYNDYNALTIEGYRLDNTVSITLRDINLVDDVLIAALKSGANEVQDVQFYTSELRSYRDQARELAMQAAQEKAQALAGAAGAQADCVLHISENSWVSYYGGWRGGRQAAIWAQNVMQNSAGEAGTIELGDSPISLGQIAVRAEVSVSYSLR